MKMLMKTEWKIKMQIKIEIKTKNTKQNVNDDRKTQMQMQIEIEVAEPPRIPYEIALLHVKTPYHKAIWTRNDIIQHCTAIIYYSEKHCRRALTNSKNVNAVFINKFAVKGSTNYSVLVHILWKCSFKLMQYSMVYSVSCRSISRRLLFMHFTGMPV